jgi:hypothetical protein
MVQEKKPVRRKRKKILPSKRNRYYLFVKFLPQYINPQETVTYNSNNLEKLKVRANDERYKYAYSSLMDRRTGTNLGVYTHEGVFSMEKWRELIEKRVKKPAILRGSVIFKTLTKIQRINDGKPELLTIYAKNNPSGETSKKEALQNIVQQVLNSPYKYDFNRVNIYDGATNELCGFIDQHGEVTVRQGFFL